MIQGFLESSWLDITWFVHLFLRYVRTLEGDAPNPKESSTLFKDPFHPFSVQSLTSGQVIPTHLVWILTASGLKEAAAEASWNLAAFLLKRKGDLKVTEPSTARH